MENDDEIILYKPSTGSYLYQKEKLLKEGYDIIKDTKTKTIFIKHKSLINKETYEHPSNS